MVSCAFRIYFSVTVSQINLDTLKIKTLVLTHKIDELSSIKYYFMPIFLMYFYFCVRCHNYKVNS